MDLQLRCSIFEQITTTRSPFTPLFELCPSACFKMSRLFLSGSRKICVSAANSRRNLAQKDERKQSSPQPPEIHEHSLQEGNINHSTLPENEQESTEDNARESTTALPLQTNIAGTESQTHCLEMSYLQGTDK